MTPAPRTDSRRGDHEPNHTNANHEEIADETGPATPRHPGSSAPRAKRPVDLLAGRPLYWIAALASVAIVLLIGVEITQDRTRVLDDARADARHIRDALVEHTRQTFAAIDVALGSIADDIDPDSLSSADTHRTLAARTKAIAPALTLWILDERGVMVASSHAEIPASMDLAQGDTFRHHAAVVEDGIFVAQPRLGVFGPTRDQWVLTVSRRLDDADGEFAGVVASSVSIEYQNNFYNAVRPGDTGIIGLFHINGPILAGSPFSPDHNGFDASETTRFHELLPTSQSGMLRADMIDGINRIKAYAWVRDLPLVVLVGVGTAERLGGWRNRAITEASIGGLAIALIWLLATSLRRRVREQQAQGEARVAQISRLTQVSTDLMACHSTRDALEMVSRVAREIVPAHQALVSVSKNRAFSDVVRCASLSGKYAAWRDFDAPVDGSGIYRLLIENKRPMRMTQAALEDHPAWKEFGAYKAAHPPMRGWLAAPVVTNDGELLGTIQLSDRVTGEFTEEDEVLLVELAHITANAVQRLHLDEARRAAVDESEKQRAEAEEARREAELARQEIESIFSSITDAVYVLDADWRFTFLNRRAEEILERKAADLIGRYVWGAFPEARQTIVYEEFHRARRDGVAVDAEIYYPPLDRWLHARGFPHDNGLTVYFRDISDQVLREQQLRQAQKMDAIGSLTGGIAHDFNNLLTVILGNAQILARALEADDRKHYQAVMIADAAERASTLTARLLAFARRQPLDPKPVQVSALIRALEPLLDRSLGEQYDLVLDLRDELPRANIDPGQLETALLNLIINARDAMPDGGTVTIQTMEVFIDEGYLENTPSATPGCHLLIAVSDTGVGIEAKDLPRLFEPFYTTKEPGQGTGLGLSMVYGFIKQSEGHVNVYSEPGLGSTFRLYLPCADTAVSADDGEKYKPPTSERAGTERILVVEDDDFVREFTQVTLAALGYDVVTTSNGPDAVDLIENDTGFDLLLTDVILGGPMNGRQVADAAREMIPNLRVLYMSGYTENIIVQNGRLKPGAHLLMKPFTRADIAHRLREMLDEPV